MVKVKLKVREVFDKDQIKILLAEYPIYFNLGAKWSGKAGRPSKERKLKNSSGKQVTSPSRARGLNNYGINGFFVFLEVFVNVRICQGSDRVVFTLHGASDNVVHKTT